MSPNQKYLRRNTTNSARDTSDRAPEYLDEKHTNNLRGKQKKACEGEQTTIKITTRYS